MACVPWILFFPTSLCGVLVFDSVSRAPSPPPASSSRFLTYTTINLTYNNFTSHTHTQQHTTTHNNTQQHTTTHNNTHQHTPTHTNTHQHTPTHTNTHQHTPTHTHTHLLGDIHFRSVWHTHTHTLRHSAWQAWHLAVVLRGRRGTDGTGWRAWTGLGAAVTPVTPRHFCMAGVALGDIHLDITWQAWHEITSTVALRGRRGTYGTGWRAWSGFVASAPRHFAWQAWHFAWQAWHLVTSTLISRGRRGTNSHLPSFCVAGVALMALGGALGPALSPGRRATLRGRRGTWWHPPWYHVAGVARTHIYRRFAWQAWHLWYWVSRLVRLCRLGAAPLCVAGVALGDIHLDITWQAWHELTSTVALRGRRGTYGTGWRAWSGFVAWAPRYFAWQAWHLVTSTLISRSRRGTNSHLPSLCTNSHLPSLCVAGVALMVLGGALGPALSPRRRATLRGRRGTWWHPPWYHVAGVARTHIYRRFAWQAWHLWYWVSRLVPLCRLGAAPLCVAGVALCVAGVALGDIHLDITWQAWHELTSTVVLRGRRSTLFVFS